MKLLASAFVFLGIALNVELVDSTYLVAYISQFGLHGEINFSPTAGKTITITTNLETTLQYPDQSWSWGIHQFPVDYTNVHPTRRCEPSELGQQILSFDDALGYLTLPGNETSRWEKEYNLTGETGLWGKSLVLSNPDNGFKICATIITKFTQSDHIAEARFNGPIGGSIYLRWLASKETNHADTLIHSNLYHVQDPTRIVGNREFTEHSWKIYVTDIFDIESEKTEANCNTLQLVFDPQDKGKGKSIGDIDERVGKLMVTTNYLQRPMKQLFRDEDLVLLPSDLNGPSRKLYIVIFDPNHPDSFIGCAKIRHLKPKTVKALINGGGIKGEITMTQRTKFDPTWLNFVTAASTNEQSDNLQFARDVASFKIHELPPAPTKAGDKDYCESSGEVFNPTRIEAKKVPPPGYGTQEQYMVGDISGKLHNRNKQDFHSFYIPDGISSELSGIYWDAFLPLEGPSSVAHRGIVLNKYDRTDPKNITETSWACGTLALYENGKSYQIQMTTAQLLFRYPVVGRIVFRQPRDEPWQDTTVIVEYLIHADGSTQNNTDDHRWAIHYDPPGKDFYDWQNRCLSSGDVFNPHKVSFEINKPEEKCTQDSVELCRMGDLWNRLGRLSIAGNKANAQRLSRRMFIDRNLPLSGYSKILGKSVVLYGDNGPVARGERLACSIIGGHYRRKVVAKDWHSNGDPLAVSGELEMFQQSEYDLTNVELEFKGLNENSGYHVHIAPVEGHLEFPCEDSSLYGHWNPRNVNPRLSPLPTRGSTDEYEMGDLSGKFGTLDNYTMFKTHYNDTRLPLFGYESVIGRSIVIHKREKNRRWACSTLERGYSPNDGREIRAIASFHNPLGFAYGYIRMTQLIGSDDSQSDTIIEVKLRHPGVNDRNLTRHHHWKIFVNPVGVDATVKGQTRCVAGGYVWNPYYTQLADPLNGDLYRTECGADNPLRCYVGDASSRLGTIDIGDKRSVFTDPNLPLEGPINAMGRSIVILGPNYGSDTFACANIEPDHDIVKYINIQRPPRFVVAQFLDDVREVLGLPEWMLAIDSRNTNILHGGSCIQMKIHFQGPIAHLVEQDFSKLLATGRLAKASLYIPGYNNQKRKSRLSYRTCSVLDPSEKNKKKNRNPFAKSSAVTCAQTKWQFIGLTLILILSRISFN